MSRPERFTGYVLPDSMVASPVPPEQISKGMEYLEAAASEHNRTVNEVRESLDPTFKREGIFQAFLAKADGQISIQAMRTVLRMEPIKVKPHRGQEYNGFDPFAHHWKIYTEAKARRLAKSLASGTAAKSA